MNSTGAIITKENKYICQTYKRMQLHVVKGKGKYLWDKDGKKYLDFFSGVSVCNFGHCHPLIVSAIQKQAKELLHVSNHYYTTPNILLAEKIINAAFPGKVFFSNSGAEANECAIKYARKWGSDKNKYEIVVFNNSFHGRTLATLTATGQKKFHKGFEPLVPGFKYAVFNDIESVKKLINNRTAAVFLEPVQGEGGVIPAKKEFIKALKSLCKRHNMLLMFDEIQTGMGRTGKIFAFQYYGVKPDVITVAKSLGSGLPIGATIVDNKIASVFGYGDHGSTFGGGPVPSAAALASLQLLTPALLHNVTRMGDYFMKQLLVLKSTYRFIKEVRGAGLMLGVELAFECRDIVKSCQQKGLIINCTNNTVLRFLPPLIINQQDIDKAVGILKSVLSKI